MSSITESHPKHGSIIQRQDDLLSTTHDRDVVIEDSLRDTQSWTITWFLYLKKFKRGTAIERLFGDSYFQ